MFVGKGLLLLMEKKQGKEGAERIDGGVGARGRGGPAMISKGGGKKHRSRIMKQRGSVVYFYEENSQATRQDWP